MPTRPPASDRPASGLSSETREDIWALLIALIVLLLCLALPEAMHEFHKSTLLVM